MTSWSSTNASSEPGTIPPSRRRAVEGRSDGRSRTARSPSRAHPLPGRCSSGSRCLRASSRWWRRQSRSAAVHRPIILLVECLIAVATASFAAALVIQVAGAPHSAARRSSLSSPAPPVDPVDPAAALVSRHLRPGRHEPCSATMRSRRQRLAAQPRSAEHAVCIGRAAVALAIFMLAYHLASGQTRRHPSHTAIAVAGLLAVAIGIGHRIFGVSQSSTACSRPPLRALMTGPFVNGNHTAELLELAAFVCLACSFSADTALNRIGWLSAAALAPAARSRRCRAAAVAGDGHGRAIVFGFLRYLAPTSRTPPAGVAAVAWGALILGLVVRRAGPPSAPAAADRSLPDRDGHDGRAFSALARRAARSSGPPVRDRPGRLRSRLSDLSHA